MTDLQLICEVCAEPIDGVTGNLWIDSTKVTRRAGEVAKWTHDRTHSGGKSGSYVLASGGDLFSYPEVVPWQSHHTVCDPDPDANAYHLAANRIDTWAELCEWTGHLMEKGWLIHTDWGVLMRGIHTGRRRLTLRIKP